MISSQGYQRPTTQKTPTMLCSTMAADTELMREREGQRERDRERGAERDGERQGEGEKEGERSEIQTEKERERVKEKGRERKIMLTSPDNSFSRIK